jgi:hypothetical protein
MPQLPFDELAEALLDIQTKELEDHEDVWKQQGLPSARRYFRDLGWSHGGSIDIVHGEDILAPLAAVTGHKRHLYLTVSEF